MIIESASFSVESLRKYFSEKHIDGSLEPLSDDYIGWICHVGAVDILLLPLAELWLTKAQDTRQHFAHLPAIAICTGQQSFTNVEDFLLSDEIISAEDFSIPLLAKTIETIRLKTELQAQSGGNTMVSLQAKFDHILHSIDQELFAVDSNMNLIGFNNKWRTEFERFFGYSPSIGLNLKDHNPLKTSEKEELVALFVAAFKGKNSSRTFELLDRESLVKYVKVSVYPMTEAGGKVVGATCHVEDITNLVKTQNALTLSENNLNELLNGLNHMAFSIDKDYRLIKYNSKWFNKFTEIYNQEVKPGDNLVFSDIIPQVAKSFWIPLYEQVFEGQALQEELPFWQNEKHLLWFKITINPIKNISGQTTGAVTYLEDITQWHSAQEEIFRREKNLTLATKLVEIYPWEFIIKNEYITIFGELGLFLENPEYNHQITPQQLVSYFHPEDADEEKKRFASAVQHGTPINAEHRFLVNGKVKWVRVKAEALLNEHGEVEKIVGVMRNITQTKERELALLNLNQKLDLALEGSGAAMWEIDFDQNLMTVDVRWTQMLGYNPSEIENISPAFLEDITHPDDRELSKKVLQDYMNGHIARYSVSVRLRKKDNTYLWVWAQAQCNERSADGKPLNLIGTNTDIDKLRKGEIAIRDSEKKYRFLIENLNTMVWTANSNGQLDFINEQVKKYFPSDHEMILEENGWLSVVHPDEREAAAAKWVDCIKSATPYKNTFRVHDRNQWRWVEVSASPFKNEDGIIEKWIGTLIDRQDELNAQKALVKSEQRFKSMIEGALDIFYIIDTNHRIQFVSKRVTDILGYEIKELIGQPFITLIHPTDHERSLEAVAKIDTLNHLYGENLKIYHKNGSAKWFNAQANVVRDHEGNAIEIQGVLTNIDQQKHNEDLLKRSVAYSLVELETANHLAGITDVNTLFQFAGKKLTSLAGDNGIMAISMAEHNQNNFRIKIIEGQLESVKRALKVMNIELIDKELKFNKNFYNQLNKGKFVKSTGDLGHLVTGPFSLILKLVTSTLFSKYVLYTKGLFYKNRMVAVVSVYFHLGNKNVDVAQIESFTTQLGNTLQRLLYYEELKSSEANLLEAQKIAKLGSWEYDIMADQPTWSPEAYRIMGVDSHSTPPGVDAHESFMYPGEFDKFKALVSRAAEKGIPFETKLKMRIDNKPKWAYTRGKAELDAEGKPVKLAGIIQDITESELLNQSLQERENLLNLSQDLANMGSWHINLQNNNIRWSSHSYTIFGLQPFEEISYQKFLSIIHPDDVEAVKANYESALETGVFELKYRIVVNGEIKILHDKGVFLKDKNGLPTEAMGTVMDITKAQELNQRLAKNKQMLEMAQEVAKMGSWQFIIATNKMYWTAQTFHIFGMQNHEDGEINYDEYIQFVHEADKVKLINKREAGKKTGQYDVNYRIVAGGHTKWISEKAVVTFDRNGQAVEMYGTMMDITDELMKEQELHEAHERNYYLTQSTFDLIFDWNLNSRKLEWSGNPGSIFGNVPVATVDDCIELIHPETLKQLREQFKTKVFHSKDNKLSLEVKMRKANGLYAHFTALLLLVRHTDQSLKRVIGSLKDIDLEVNTRIQNTLRLSSYSLLNNTKRSFEDRLADVCHFIREHFNLSVCEMWMVNIDKTRMYRKAEAAKDSPWQLFIDEGTKPYVGKNAKGLKNEAWKLNAPVYVDVNEQSQLFVRRQTAAALGAQSAVAYPLAFNKQVVAVLIMVADYSKYDLQSNFQIFEPIANILASEIQKTNKEQETTNFFDLSLDLFAIAGFDGYYKQVNHAFQNMLGYEKHEVLQKQYMDLVHPDDREKSLEIVQQAMANHDFKKSHFFENRLVTKDNKTVWIAWTFVIRAHEELIYAVGREVTERVKQIKAIELQNQKLREIAWTQSHVVRAPLVNIMGLITLLEMGVEKEIPIADILKAMKISAEEFDKVITEITKKSEQLAII
ncbi:PAS domain-containing protein [bacterium]|nr:PAS domain-containing protein [bacterium]